MQGYVANVTSEIEETEIVSRTQSSPQRALSRGGSCPDSRGWRRCVSSQCPAICRGN